MRTRAVLVAVLALGTALSAQAPTQPVFRSGVELVTIDVVATTRGVVFEQAGPRARMRELDRSASVTISTLVSADGLDGTVAPLSFALGPAGGVPQKTWPVQLGIPLANGLWRVALTLRAPLPSGNLELQLLHTGLLLHDNCLAQFVTR